MKHVENVLKIKATNTASNETSAKTTTRDLKLGFHRNESRRHLQYISNMCTTNNVAAGCSDCVHGREYQYGTHMHCDRVCALLHFTCRLDHVCAIIKYWLKSM